MENAVADESTTAESAAASTAAEPTDRDLVAAVIAGETQVFDRIVYRHQNLVRAFIARYVSIRDAKIDDLVQETFVAAYKSLARFQQNARFSTWLLGIARNTTLSWLRSESRRQRRERNGIDELVQSWGIADLDDCEPDRETDLLHALRHCLDDLPKKHDKLLQMAYSVQMRCEDIADKVGRKPGAVRTMLSRIRKVLRSCIERSLMEVKG